MRLDLLRIGVLLSEDDGRKSITLINRIANTVKKEMAKSIAADAERYVLEHFKQSIKNKKEILKKAGDPKAEMVEDMIIISVVNDAVKSFKKGLSNFHGLSDKT